MVQSDVFSSTKKSLCDGNVSWRM